ncbi:LysE family translocator [Photobacterium ganghwense]|uniref:Threonine transporter n=1 Tax=Photobacterium ganghwense TaxID=320778 RepID=A0A0J1JUV0_9GAMM|nr:MULTISPECIES: LysE family translocator [Photobacterium]KLV06087.1 threonine transporter [Photobacterium ganghwense]PSU04981.1 LysE family translocator [Photobacterium ganghwense]QSV14017.1 LysE family translocator [Photobacterium ganghwense]
MNEATTLLTLLTVHFIALMSPGPDFALVVQNAGRYGRQTGVMIALGLSLGILLHSILSLTGASLLIHQHPTLFALLQAAGSGYLLWLGIGALKGTWHYWQQRHNASGAAASTSPGLTIASKRQALARGFTTNILNPKALVFFLSLLSTLVPAGMSLSGKVSAIGMLWLLSFLWFAMLAWLLTGERLQQKLRAWTPIIDGLCGLLFTAIGGTILLNLLLA